MLYVQNYFLKRKEKNKEKKTNPQEIINKLKVPSKNIRSTASLVY